MNSSHCQRRFTLKLEDDSKQLTTLHTPLNMILRNFIGNAIKHHDKTKAIISISFTPHQHHYEITVADDGPGIDPKYYEKVFQMFQTLKPRDKVEGSGMGMSIVKEIITTYGGEIHIEENPPRGCRFCITWPKEDRPKAITDKL